MSLRHVVSLALCPLQCGMLELPQGRSRRPRGIHGRKLRHHHRWRRRCRLRAGEPALGALRPFRAAARSRPGYAARPRARRRARYLSGVLLQRRLFLAGAEGALAARQQFAAHRLFAGPHHGRRLLGDGHGGAARHARRLRRMGGRGRHRLGLERRAAVFPQARDRQGFAGAMHGTDGPVPIWRLPGTDGRRSRWRCRALPTSGKSRLSPT